MCFVNCVIYATNAIAEPAIGEIATLTEPSLRARAQGTIRPQFPASAMKTRAEGVAVAELEINSTGAITSLTILQAPDRSIEEAFASTVRSWKFAPLVNETGVAIKARGKLTYYFVIENHVGHVFDPIEAVDHAMPTEHHLRFRRGKARQSTN